MMAPEIETYVPRDEPHPVGALAAWVKDFEGVAAVAMTLAATSFIPDSIRVYRDPERREGYDAAATAAHVAAAILTGHELGLNPMASLRSIDVIKGTPALRAVALRGILQSAGHELWVEEASNNRATVCGRRNGSDHVARITWTIEDARTRGLANRPLWRAAARNMLIARATADVARLVAADALLGTPYTVEEIQDGDAEPAADTPTPSPRKARRQPLVLDRAPRDVPEPPADTPPPARRRPPADDTPPTDDEPRAGMATAEQVTAVRRALVAAGLGTTRKQLDAVAQIVGRQVERHADMTADEAVAVLDAAAERAMDPDADAADEWERMGGNTDDLDGAP